MTTGLLTSKFYYPPHHPDLIQRPYLFKCLDAGLGKKLTLVSAPAGFGKTTAVSEWIRDRGHPTAWLSLDKNDNDLSRFLIYLTAALQGINPEIGLDVQAALEESLSPHFEILLTRIISELEGLPAVSIIVLDDYHLINTKAIHDAINFLIEYLPPKIHLVITGRMDPPLPISRLRVHGEVNEVRASELRFSKEEVADFFNDRMGFNVLPNGIEALEARTEGWVASLKLAALSMQGRQDVPDFIAKFSGSNRYVIDYLVDEVMARQSEEVRVFLRRTSILERFCAPLCAYIIDEKSDLDIIDYLDRSNLFLIPLDDQRQWYRYHHLFSDFLSQRLLQAEPDIIPILHRRACQWYQNEGMVYEAIHHALVGCDMESATQLVDQIASGLVVRRENNKLLRLLNQLPPDQVQNFLLLRIWHAWALLFLGQVEGVEPILQGIEADQFKTPKIPITAYVTTLRAFMANIMGDYQKAIDLSKDALEMMANVTPDRTTLIFQGSAIVWLGFNHRLLGDLETAKPLLIEAVEINQRAGNIYAALACFEQLADLALIHGQLHLASDIYQRGLKLAQNLKEKEHEPSGSLIAAAGLQMDLGTLLYQFNDLDGAAVHIQHSVDLLELGELWGRMFAYTILAYLKQATGEFEIAAELLTKAFTIEDSISNRRAYTPGSPSLTKLAIILSRSRSEMAYLLDNACRYVEKQDIHADDEVDFTSRTDYPREFLYSELSCMLIAQDRSAEALPLLMRLMEAAVAMDRQGDEIRYLVMIAIAQYDLGDTQAALAALSRSLTLAAPEGYIRIFIDEGQPMAELLQLALLQNIVPDYAHRLLTAFPEYILNESPINREQATNPQYLVEPLSEREIEVLRLMAEGYKYQEIADKLVISVNTVRHHTRNVYGKLEVNNRTQAIGKATKLNLM